MLANEAPLACFPMRADLPADFLPKEVQPYPTPLATSKMPPPAVQPAPVRDLAFLATAAGWQVRITYSRGWLPHSIHGTPSAKPKELWALRMKMNDQQAVAVRIDGSWASFWTWSPRRFFTRSTLLTAFNAELGKDF